MENHEIESWYEKNKQRVVYALAGRYGCEPGHVEDAVQDVIVGLLNRKRPLRHKSIEYLERLLWVAVDNRLKAMYNKDTKRRQVEGEYVESQWE